MTVASIVIAVGLLMGINGAVWLPRAEYRDRSFVIALLMGGILTTGVGIGLMAFGT